MALLEILSFSELNEQLWESVRYDYYSKGGFKSKGFEMEDFRKMSNRLTEGLISSVDVDDLGRLLEKKFPNLVKHFVITSYEALDFRFSFQRRTNSDIDLNEALDVFKFLNNLGWYPIKCEVDGIERSTNDQDKFIEKMPNGVKESGFTEDDLLNIASKYYKGAYSFLFEPKYTKPVEDLPKYLYHVSDTKNRQSIKSKGLLPKSKSKLFNHDTRIYLLIPDSDVEDYRDYGRFINHLISYYRGSTADVYRIETSKLPDKIKFSKDTFSDNGVYTTTPIPYKNLELIDVLEPNNNSAKLISARDEFTKDLF
jgi:hypothetical protein